jgi:hypothetical protein
MTGWEVRIADITPFDACGHALAPEVKAVVNEALLDLLDHDELPGPAELINREYNGVEVTVTGTRGGYYHLALEFLTDEPENPRFSCTAALRRVEQEQHIED